MIHLPGQTNYNNKTFMKGSPTKVLIRLRCQTNPDKGRFTRLKCLTCLPSSPTIFGSLCQQQCLGGAVRWGGICHTVIRWLVTGKHSKIIFIFWHLKNSNSAFRLWNNHFVTPPENPQDHSLKQEPQYFLGSSLSYTSWSPTVSNIDSRALYIAMFVWKAPLW